LALSGAALAFLLAWLFGRWFIQAPVNRLVDTIEAWRSGDRAARTGMQQGTAEFHRVGYAIDHMLDQIDQRQSSQEKAEAHRDLLARELNHRVKNQLATVQAVARQTFKNVLPGDENASAFIGRLDTMAAAHNLLTDGQEEVADLERTIWTAIQPFDPEASSPFEVSGPELILKAKATLSLAMALHELCTNAAKYGALSNNSGKIAITWSAPQEGRFTIVREEFGGPVVTPPVKEGFGSKMILRALAADFGAKVEFDYSPAGLVCSIDASAEQALSPPGDPLKDQRQAMPA
jgi:two-component sensor histidine kinase